MMMNELVFKRRRFRARARSAGRKEKSRKGALGRVSGRAGRARGRKWQQGGLTAEAAFVLPLFFFCVLTLISFLEMYRISMINTVRLQQEAEELGRLAGLTGIGSGEIDLYESVPWSAGYYSAFGASAGIACRARVRAWTGRSGAGGGASQGASDTLVYVTDNQSVYHTDSRCTHLSLRIQTADTARVPSLRNNDGKRYHACDKCAAGRNAAPVSYITPEGDHFHYDAECGALTRTTRMEKLSCLPGLHICSRCAEHEAA